ncbi:uncharacterized protein LOC128546026 isoform X2 [Mercenaria mercenaria]|uniref:uncharacterized protein LOC128546026 isoform X2 n=1 Tax=Mercenaria mercenaria TaxID=6596 RepID=UPI00234ED69C|nr:uncharacterized protein LOC128546026 isoform X2 [Mercenaria mercenaria]XP_053379898.1 uncharacterized protein LOC128546026 isoform X2 [Mercenaria mercenaria]
MGFLILYCLRLDLTCNENCDGEPVQSPVERRACEYQRKVCSSIGHENNNSGVTSASKRKAEFPVQTGKRIKVVSWTEEQLAVMQRSFAKNLRCLRVPNKEECEQARKNGSLLLSRDWKNIIFRAHHEIQRLKKK